MGKRFKVVLIAIDTSLGTSVAVLKENGDATEANSDDPMAHTEVIGTLIAETLEKAAVVAAEITGVVQGVGPGPFTGLRVGMTAAQSFAFALDVPLYSVVSHDAVAYGQQLESKEAVRIVQDAKRRELFVTRYDSLAENGLPMRISGPEVVTRADYEEQNETERAKDFWPKRVSATMLAHVAANMLKHGKAFESTAALYLRQPDVNLIAQQKTS